MVNIMSIKRFYTINFIFSAHILRRENILALLSMMCMAVKAQTTVTLTIVDRDAATVSSFTNTTAGAPKTIANLPVMVTACDSTFRVVTGTNGTAAFTVFSPACTRVRIRIKSSFYENVDTLLDCTPPTAGHSIPVQKKTQRIKQVEVVAFRPVAKNDAQKSVYTIDTRGLLKTTKADRALAFLPGIEVTNGSYTLLGQTRNMRIKVDGKPASVDELKAINARDIARVEVREMTKDDDSGTAGEINIVKRRQEHPKIYATLSTWTGVLRPQVGTYDNFGFQNRKWDVIAYVNLVRHTQQSETAVDRYFANPALPVQHLTLNRTIKTMQDAERIKINYLPSDRVTVTLSAYHNGYPADATDSGTEFTGTSYLRTSNEHIDHYGGYTNLGYRFNDKNSVTLKGNYYYYSYSIEYPGGNIDNYKSSMREYSGELLWENRSRLFGSDHDINAGVKNIFRQNLTSSVHHPRKNYSIQQLYLTDFFSLSKRLSANIILKGEMDNQRGRQYYAFLPSLRLNYNLPGRTSLTASYQRRITRPSVDYTNSDTLFINDYTKRVGNAGLQAQRNDGLGLSWRKQIKSAYLTLSANYEHEADVISEVYATSGNYDVTTYANIGSSDYAAMSANYTQRFFRNRMNVSLSLTGFHKIYHMNRQLDAVAWCVPTKGWGWNANVNMSYLSSKGWMYTVSSNYRPKSYSLNGVFHRNPQLFLTVTKSLFKDRLELELNFLNSLVYCWGTRSETFFNNMRQQTTRKLYANNITISVAWNIGRQFRSRRVADGISNDDIVTKKGE